MKGKIYLMLLSDVFNSSQTDFIARKKMQYIENRTIIKVVYLYQRLLGFVSARKCLAPSEKKNINESLI